MFIVRKSTDTKRRLEVSLGWEEKVGRTQIEGLGFLLETINTAEKPLNFVF